MGFLASLFQMGFGLARRWVDRGSSPEAGVALDAGGAWKRGMVAGAVGYAVVVVTFAGLNILGGQDLFLTPALLGQALLGESATAAVHPATVLVYNGLHLIVFLALGLAGAWLLFESELHPVIWYPALVLYLVAFFHLVGFVLVLSAPAGQWIPAWAVVGASAAAGLSMVGYLLAARPEALAAARRVDLEA
jgi:hypothetical protein